MVAFLAALPAIFSAIKSGAELFGVGKRVVEEVRGDYSNAETPEDLISEINDMSPDQQAQFVDRMRSELELYDAISARLTQQGGQVDAATLDSIPPKERGRVALMRMTTRPWAVRWMVISIVFPPLSLVTLNLFLALINVISAGVSEAPLLFAYIEAGNVINDLYLNLIGWAAGVIMTYMGMREIGKAVGNQDSPTVADISGSVRGFFNAVKGVIK